MTPAQTELLRQLIEADTTYWLKSSSGEPTVNDDRGVEIGPISGHSLRTARVLVELGLIETLEVRRGQVYAFLGRYSPSEEPLPRRDS